MSLYPLPDPIELLLQQLPQRPQYVPFPFTFWVANPISACHADNFRTGIPAVQNTILQYCSAYSATISKSSTVAPSSSSTGSAAVATSTQTSTTTTGNQGSSSSSSSLSPSGTHSAAAGAGFAVSPAHSYGALAGFLAVAGAFL